MSNANIFLGSWENESGRVFTISMAGEAIDIKPPDNETWKYRLSNIEIVGEELWFISEAWLKNGEVHPFNHKQLAASLKFKDGINNVLWLTAPDGGEQNASPEKLTKIQ